MGCEVFFLLLDHKSLISSNALFILYNNFFSLFWFWLIVGIRLFTSKIMLSFFVHSKVSRFLGGCFIQFHKLSIF